MKIDIVMPKMGESVTEGTIIKWYKKPGDTVKKDEIIFEISTDKVDTEIPCAEDGVLVEILVNEQETVDAGVVVARLSTEKGDEVAAPEPVKTPAPQSAPVSIPEPQEVMTVIASASNDEEGELTDIPMPKMGESVMDGTIIKWYKKVGDPVKKDETFFEISTDKVDTEIPSPEDGFVVEILVHEQETVDVGTIVARISTSASAKPAQKKSEAPVAQPVSTPSEPIPSMHDVIAANAQRNEPVEVEESGSDRFYSPLVMNIAKKQGVSSSELDTISGTGIGGRVTKNDILKFIEIKATQSAKPVSVSTPAPASAPVQANAAAQAPSTSPMPSFVNGETEVTPMDNIRRKIMGHMVMSRDTSVHVTELAEVDMSKIYRFLQAKKAEIEKTEGVKLTYMPFIAHAVNRALRDYPLVNASIDGNNIVQKKFINLGIAVSMQPNGLIVPNIKNAQNKNIVGLAKAINDIALRARNRKLTPDDITNGTFTITNYGVFGTLFGTPIINQPEVAILGVGAVVKRAVVIEVDGQDTIAIKPMMYLTLAHDHRLVDGMLGGLFLKAVKENLENFNENWI
ncbi:MAG: 2-oxoglutarate dehydrogenase, E2 component, dihydrolipoamide succinyltransferase [Ignavibacteriales bacterium]|nr:2-oxoglutarate dehydrogenase, E2 component, dihydrolipoamide succinyltransferase [Ignavibacteriales bacterium]